MTDIHEDGLSRGPGDRLDAFSAREVLRSALYRAPVSRRTRSGSSPQAPAVIPTPNVPAADSAEAARPDSGGLPRAATATDPSERILRCAEDLGIPWKRLLAEEIEAEQRLRRYL